MLRICCEYYSFLKGLFTVFAAYYQNNCVYSSRQGLYFSVRDSCEIISKSDQRFKKRRFFKELLKKFYFVTMTTSVYDGIKFCQQFLKWTSQGRFLPSLVQIGPAVWEEMFKEIVARRTQDLPKSSS